MDVVLGSGFKYLMPSERKDKEDILSVIPSLGYDYVTTPEKMKASTSSKLWGFFGDDAMAYDMDRDPAKQPSLAEMTDKAISVLSKNKSGFFLMVEGSKVDWAAHANDPVGVISDVLAFDKAVKVALDFAKKDGNTMLLAMTDHGNGGISIGDSGTTGSYDNDPLEKFMAPLEKAKLTGEGLESKILPDKSNIADVMSQYFGINDLTEAEIKAIASAKAGSLNSTVGPMISKRAHIGWTTGGHTGEDITLYSYLPGNERITGVIDNTDIAKLSAKFLNVDLDSATKKLFVPTREAFQAKGAKVNFNDSNPENPVIEVTKDSTTLKLFVNKNIAELNGAAVKLSGVVVYDDNSTFVPSDAVDLIK
jgi:alkaline phosphatase